MLGQGTKALQAELKGLDNFYEKGAIFDRLWMFRQVKLI